MPQRNPSPCTWPGCVNLAPKGSRCPECRARTRRRRAAIQATYADPAWKDTSRRYRALHPQCEWPGCDRPSREVDHIDGLGPAGPRGHDWMNLRALCKPCHSRRTALDSGLHTRN